MTTQLRKSSKVGIIFYFTLYLLANPVILYLAIVMHKHESPYMYLWSSELSMSPVSWML